jgi:hypothetical protein
MWIMYAKRNTALLISEMLLIAAMIAASQEADGTTIIDLPKSGGSVATRADMGESITVPTGSDTRLDRFQFYGMGAGSDVVFDALVYEFDPMNMKTVGLPLYTSSLQVAIQSTLKTFVFDTGGINLAPGGKYLLELRQKNYGNIGNLQMDYSSMIYSGGGYLTGSDSLNIWVFRDNPQSLAFQAVFNPVPEPSAFILLGIGSLGLLAYQWRRWK